jgi:DNA-binding MarR family transcriptional regulator
MLHRRTSPIIPIRTRTLIRFRKLRHLQQTINAITTFHKLGPLQAAILFLAWERAPRPIGQSELAILLDVRAPTLTVSLRLLSRRNLIRIKPRRVNHSTKLSILTPSGQKFIEQLRDQMAIALNIKP